MSFKKLDEMKSKELSKKQMQEAHKTAKAHTRTKQKGLSNER